MAIRYSSVAGGTSSDFTVSTTSSQNTTYDLNKTYSSGLYYVSTTNQDTSYDIYAISDAGILVGYTNSNLINISESFSSLVIFGVAPNDEIIFEYRGPILTPTSSGDMPAAAAFVSSVTQSSLPNADDTTTIIGGNFASDVEVYFIDNTNAQTPAKGIVRSSSTSLVVTRPEVFATDKSPYSIKVSNPNVPPITSEQVHTLSNSITAGTNPVWQTAASQVYNVGSSVSILLIASDTENSDIDYSIVSGTLPTGLSIDIETGEISGTPTTQTAGASNSFTIRATDAGGNYLDRQFNFTANTTPTWVTASTLSLGSGALGGSGYQLVATPSLSGATMTYSIISGSLQSGLTLSQDGKISGTPVINSPAATFTVRATDQYGLYADNEITLSISFSLSIYSYGVTSAAAGGWTVVRQTGGSISYNADHIYTSVPSVNSYDIDIATNNAIDITNYSTLKINWKTTDYPYNAYFGIASSQTSSPMVASKSRIRTNADQIDTLDISAYNGSYYIVVATHGAENLSWNEYSAGGNIKTYEIELLP